MYARFQGSIQCGQLALAWFRHKEKKSARCLKRQGVRHGAWREEAGYGSLTLAAQSSRGEAAGSWGTLPLAAVSAGVLCHLWLHSLMQVKPGLFFFTQLPLCSGLTLLCRTAKRRLPA